MTYFTFQDSLCRTIIYPVPPATLTNPIKVKPSGHSHLISAYTILSGYILSGSIDYTYRWYTVYISETRYDYTPG